MEQSLRHAAAVLLCLIAPIQCVAQAADFKVTWTTVAELASSAGKDALPSRRGTRISRVDVQPTIVEVAVGKQVCIGSLQVRAFGADGRPVAGAPLEMAVRKDHKLQLQLTHAKDICMRPAQGGEYPIRFTSKLPAPDDTLRGAQVFIRAH